eukprot:CAMPEP_0202850966 /NCGR_PEP_ID=MMETSP1389-20130828/85029_1 /ASSEMBLY_ACC=CAM_ASM_000865 /TAXON_ID=302021 /ORGANISM="Rhodomonas sp., Strain CCMP768" /LENGTH=108 /DNA_ID=CAMNT_0049529217 /DNA_START=12 /DNA_END=339 /DNA_ORIENTATION=+
MAMSAYVKIAGVSGACAIGLGAFGAHGLRGKVDEKSMAAWVTASQYHLAHSVALLAMAVGEKQLSATARTYAPPLTLAGIVLFSGSLYALVLTGVKPLGAVTPLADYA